jgi:hypothetical protein
MTWTQEQTVSPPLTGIVRPERRLQARCLAPPPRKKAFAVYRKKQIGPCPERLFWTSTQAYGGTSAYIVHLGTGNQSTCPFHTEYRSPCGAQA